MGYITGIAGENLANKDLCYKANDGKYYKAKADSLDTMPVSALTAASISSGASGYFWKFGNVTITGHGLTIGALLYASPATAGLITITAPSVSGHQLQFIGLVEDANTILFFPNLMLIEIA
jgi:hypothetical protein